jgi:hypothetical protein
MKKLADEMESAGKKLDPEEFTSYVLAGLDMDYNSVVFTIVVHVEPIMPSGLLSQMLSHELCIKCTLHLAHVWTICMLATLPFSPMIV